MTVADQVAEWLHEKGIQHAFGIIGAGNLCLWDALSRHGKTEIVPCHHEQAAVMSAGAYFRAVGKISVALVTTGAGSTNAITGVASAFMDSTPVLILSGNEASKYMYAPTRVWGVQGYDSSEFASSMTKWAARAWIDIPIRKQLDLALANAMKPRQGPVWLDIPKDIQNAVV